MENRKKFVDDMALKATNDAAMALKAVTVELAKTGMSPDRIKQAEDKVHEIIKTSSTEMANVLADLIEEAENHVLQR